jgi:hypothetical protein
MSPWRQSSFFDFSSNSFPDILSPIPTCMPNFKRIPNNIIFENVEGNEKVYGRAAEQRLNIRTGIQL